MDLRALLLRWLRALGSVPWLVVVCLAAPPRASHAESALVTTAQAVAHELGPLPRRTLVVASALASAESAPRGDELATKLSSLVAAAIGGEAIAEEHPLSLPRARSRSRTRAGKLGAMVYLDLRADAGELRITADTYAVLANGWDRVRLAPPPPSAHAFVHTPIAAEIRSYLSPIRLERARLEKFAHDAGPLLAVACGDLDLDGTNDLVLVSEREVTWGYLRAGRFVSVHRAAAASLGRRAPVPWRDPLATAAIALTDGVPALFVGWSDRIGASMGPDLTVRTRLVGMPIAEGGAVACAVPNAARGGFDRLVGCTGGESPVAVGSHASLFDAAAFVDVMTLDGHSERLVATHDARDGGTLHLVRAGAHEPVTIDDAGAQVALGDLDEDGVPEVITTTAHGEDALTIASLRGDALVPRLKWPAPRGVDAVAVCPATGADAPSVVAAVGAEIWLVH